MTSCRDPEPWTEVDDLHSALGAADEHAVLRLLTERTPSAAQRLACAPLADTGDTPIHVAARAGALALVDILLRFGADASAKSASCVLPATLAASGGHSRLAAVLERAAIDGERRKRSAGKQRRSRGLSLWLFWRIFNSRWGIVIAPWVWVVNASFAAYVYCTRLAPWVPGAVVASLHALHACVAILYLVCWALWMKCACTKPDAPSARAKLGYNLVVRSLAAGVADPEMERWISHAHAAAMGAADAVCPVTGVFVMGFDHHCSFIGNAVGHHNARPFLSYCVLLTVACALYSCLTIPQWRHITQSGQTDLVLEAALLDMCLGTVCVGQLALWQVRLAGSGVTAHHLRRFGRPKSGLKWRWSAWRTFWTAQEKRGGESDSEQWRNDLCTVEQLHLFLGEEKAAAASGATWPMHL